jgi:hypothetical protein
VSFRAGGGGGRNGPRGHGAILLFCTHGAGEVELGRSPQAAWVVPASTPGRHARNGLRRAKQHRANIGGTSASGDLAPGTHSPPAIRTQSLSTGQPPAGGQSLRTSGSLLITDVQVQAAACRDRVDQGLQLRRRGRLGHACHQRWSAIQGESQARTARSARGQDGAGGSGAAFGPPNESWPGPGRGAARSCWGG